jgi:hypothetical protein
VRFNLKKNTNLDLERMEDEDVVELVHAGSSEALEYLISKYKNFVRAKARSYFLIGADREDIVQEGMIGLYKAIRDFKEDKLSSLKLLLSYVSQGKLLLQSKQLPGKSISLLILTFLWINRSMMRNQTELF